jgi:hypothetical protein
LVEDLPYPGEGVGDSLEVAAACLGHRRAASPTSSQYARDLTHYLSGLDPTRDLGVKVGDKNSLASERSGKHHSGRTSETILDVVGDLAQSPNVGGDDLACYHPRSVDLLGAFNEVADFLETLP